MLSVALCLVLGQIVEGQWAVFACFAAVLATKETVGNSISDGLTRVISTLIGGAIAILLLLFSGEHMSTPLFGALVTAGTLVTIYFTVLIKQPDTTALAAVVFLGAVLVHQSDKFIYAGRRIVETIAGIVISVLVNLLIDPKLPELIFKRFRRKKG